MQVLGKIIGGILGFLMGGAIGACLGVFIGGFFDKALNAHLSLPYYHFRSEKRESVINAFVKTCACLMGFFAKLDGRVSEDELRYANQVFQELHLNKAQAQTAKKWFTTSKNGQVSLEDQIRMLSYLKEKNLFLCKTCLDIIYKMLKIDGLDGQKINSMNKLLSELGFSPLESIFNREEFWQNMHADYQFRQRSHQRQSYYRPPPTEPNRLDNAFKELGLASNANQPEVKKAYRKLMSQHHPDKMMAKGASEAQIKIATEKTQQISRAYEFICDQKGW